jgi:hypothetical protein
MVDSGFLTPAKENTTSAFGGLTLERKVKYATMTPVGTY